MLVRMRRHTVVCVSFANPLKRLTIVRNSKAYVHTCKTCGVLAMYIRIFAKLSLLIRTFSWFIMIKHGRPRLSIGLPDNGCSWNCLRCCRKLHMMCVCTVSSMVCNVGPHWALSFAMCTFPDIACVSPNMVMRC